MKYETHNYRNAEEILSSEKFQKLKFQLIDIINLCPNYQLEHPKVRTRNKKTLTMGTDHNAIKKYFTGELKKREWDIRPYIINENDISMRADFIKDRVQIEIQFSNVSQLYKDIFKLQISQSQDLIDVGVIIVPMTKFADTIDENVASFEKIDHELPFAKMSITLPILIIGIEP